MADKKTLLSLLEDDDDEEVIVDGSKYAAQLQNLSQRAPLGTGLGPQPIAAVHITQAANGMPRSLPQPAASMQVQAQLHSQGKPLQQHQQQQLHQPLQNVMLRPQHLVQASAPSQQQAPQIPSAGLSQRPPANTQLPQPQQNAATAAANLQRYQFPLAHAAATPQKPAAAPMPLASQPATGVAHNMVRQQHQQQPRVQQQPHMQQQQQQQISQQQRQQQQQHLQQQPRPQQQHHIQYQQQQQQRQQPQVQPQSQVQPQQQQAVRPPAISRGPSPAPQRGPSPSPMQPVLATSAHLAAVLKASEQLPSLKQNEEVQRLAKELQAARTKEQQDVLLRRLTPHLIAAANAHKQGAGTASTPRPGQTPVLNNQYRTVPFTQPQQQQPAASFPIQYNLQQQLGRLQQPGQLPFTNPTPLQLAAIKATQAAAFSKTQQQHIQQQQLQQLQQQQRQQQQQQAQQQQHFQQQPGAATAAAAAPLAAAKRPAESHAVGAQPAAKRVKKEDDEDPTDVLNDTGVNLEEEEKRLAGGRDTGPSTSMLVPQEPLCINPHPFTELAMKIASQHGIARVSPQLGKLMSHALEAHLGDLLRRAFVMGRQRADVGRRLPGMEPDVSLRKQVAQIERREREEQEAKEAAENARLLEVAASKRKADDKVREKAEKVRQAQAEKQQASATTATLQAALNTKARWANWGTKKSAAAQPLAPTASAGGAEATATGTPAGEPGRSEAAASAAAEPASAAEAGGSSQPGLSNIKAEGSAGTAQLGMRAPALAASTPGERRVLALRDLIAALERDPMYCKSTFLYKLYEQQR